MANSSSVSHLTSHLGYWLRYVSNHVSHAFARKLEAENVTVAEWAVLRELYGMEAVAPSRLADRLGLTRGAISKLADRLIAKDFINREASEDDGRAHTLALSPAGRELVPRLSALADRNDAEFFNDLTTDERVFLERILKSIVDRHGLKTIPVT